MRLMIGIALVTLLGVTGCVVSISGNGPAVVGSGVTKEEVKEVPDFTGVEISSALEATVAIGPKPSVTIIADDNILPLIQAEVKDGRLEVGLAPGKTIRTTKAQRVSIVVPTVKALAAHGASKLTATLAEGAALDVEAGGASSVKVKGLSADSVDLKVDGASRVTLVGKARRLTLEVSGASTLEAAGASFDSAKVEFAGASRGEVGVTGAIEGEVSGASTLTVRGNPGTKAVKAADVSKVSY